jgi:hypothetical protein
MIRTPQALQVKVSGQALGRPAHWANCLVPFSASNRRRYCCRGHVHAYALPAIEVLSTSPPFAHPYSLGTGLLDTILLAALAPAALASWALTAPAVRVVPRAMLADLATALQPSCFDAACQQEKDTLLVARLVPSKVHLPASQCASCQRSVPDWPLVFKQCLFLLARGLRRPSPVVLAAWRCRSWCLWRLRPTCCALHRRTA